MPTPKARPEAAAGPRGRQNASAVRKVRGPYRARRGGKSAGPRRAARDLEFDARTEKNLATLHSKAQTKARLFMTRAIPEMSSHGVDIRIISGTRSYKEQDALYAKGRTAPGPKVTNARGGYSFHNFGIAWDIGLFRGDRYLEESPLYALCGKIGRERGLEWGGDWRSSQDEPHFQIPTGLSLAEMRSRVARGESVL